MINELRIKYFLELASVLSYTQASKNLYISQQALSKQIANLEEDLGCTLFDRSGKRISLTEEGLIYKSCFAEITRLLQQAKAEADQVVFRRDKVINIGCLGGLKISDVLLDRCEPFMASRPDCKLWAGVPENFDELFSMLLDGKFDLILFTEAWAPSEYPPSIETAVLLPSPLYFYAGKQLSGSEEHLTLDVLGKQSFVTFKNPRMEAMIRTEFDQAGLKTPHFLNSSNISSSHIMARMGQCAVLGSSCSTLSNDPGILKLETSQQNNVLMAWNNEHQYKTLNEFIEFMKGVK